MLWSLEIIRQVFFINRNFLSNTAKDLLYKMTILPTIRKNTVNAEENKETNQQNAPAERSNRRNDINSIQSLSENNTNARHSPYPFKGDRKERFRKRYKETDRQRDRECVREQKREARREQKRERIVMNKRELISETLHETNTISSPVDKTAVEQPCNNEIVNKEDCTGFNSEDEYDESYFKDRHLTDEEWQKVQNRDYFEPYVTEDFEKYIARKRSWHVHGNHLEIQAMSEMYNRTIEVYCYQIEPINIFNCSRKTSYEPIRLSYHRMCHYNSISNPNKPSVGVGLGLPNYKPVDIDRRRFNDAIRASEELLIEQTMLEDKIKATDWEATNEAIEEQVARESYIQYFRDNEKRLKAQGHPLASGSSSTITSSMLSSPRSSRRGSVSPKGCQSPKGSASPNYTTGSPRTTTNPTSNMSFMTDCSNVENVPPSYVHNREEEIFSECVSFKYGEENFPNFAGNAQAGPSTMDSNIGLDDFDQGIMAQVLAESQQTYLDELKHKSKKRHGSPGPSTSS